MAIRKNLKQEHIIQTLNKERAKIHIPVIRIACRARAYLGFLIKNIIKKKNSIRLITSADNACATVYAPFVRDDNKNSNNEGRTRSSRCLKHAPLDR